jgi:hypothetical protein
MHRIDIDFLNIETESLPVRSQLSLSGITSSGIAFVTRIWSFKEVTICRKSCLIFTWLESLHTESRSKTIVAHRCHQREGDLRLASNGMQLFQGFIGDLSALQLGGQIFLRCHWNIHQSDFAHSLWPWQDSLTTDAPGPTGLSLCTLGASC